jgi:hypothetical protein
LQQRRQRRQRLQQRLQHPTSSQVLTVAVRGKPSTSHEEPTMAGRSGVLAANAFQGETAAMVFKTVAMAQMRLVARHLIKATFQVPCNAMLSIPASHEAQTMARLSGVVAASAFQCEVAATVLQIAVMVRTRWIAPPLPPPRQPLLLPPPRQPLLPPPGMMARAPSKCWMVRNVCPCLETQFPRPTAMAAQVRCGSGCMVLRLVC